MDEQNNVAGATNTNNTMNMPKKSKTNSMVLIMVVAIALIVIAIIISMRENMNEQLDTQIMQKQSEIRTNDTIAKQLDTQGTSDNLDDIEKDLNDTNVDSLTQ